MSAPNELDTGIPSGWGDPGDDGRPMRRIVVPVDEFGRAQGALSAAIRYSQMSSGELRLIHVRVWDPGPHGCRFYIESSSDATAVLADAASTAWNAGVRASGVVVDARRGKVGAVIAAEARAWGADTIVLSKRRRAAIGVLLLGSVADQVVCKACCPVIVIRQQSRSATRSAS